HGSPCHTNDRGGSAATDYTQGRLTMQPGDHTPNYTSLTDVTFWHANPLNQRAGDMQIYGRERMAL
ncbi:MAG: hypothetical protein ACOY4P_14435, partial [Pseudomonadota bacterium]